MILRGTVAPLPGFRRDKCEVSQNMILFFFFFNNKRQETHKQAFSSASFLCCPHSLLKRKQTTPSERCCQGSRAQAAVPSLMVADHTVSSVQVSTRDSLKGGACSKKASKYPFIFVTARVNFSSCGRKANVGMSGQQGRADRRFNEIPRGATPEV